jgi:hypothetical protein
MFDQVVNRDLAVSILGLKGEERLDSAESDNIILPTPGSDISAAGYMIMDLVKLQLSTTLGEVGVDGEKAFIYADAVLSAGRTDDPGSLTEWVEEEGDDLYCLLSDQQLSRIFLRCSVTGRETDIGAIKPVLLPSVNCEVNVSRVIRPVVKRAKSALSG